MDPAPGVELEFVASITPGLTAKDLRGLVKGAARQSRDRGATAAELADFEVALGQLELLAGQPLVLSDGEREGLAYREAGRTLVGMLQPGAEPRRRASLFPSSRGLRANEAQASELSPLCGENQRRGQIVAELGGLAAEQLVYGGPIAADDPDLVRATALADELLAKQGIEGDEDVTLQLLDDCMMQALAVLNANQLRLEQLAAQLLEHETLEYDEMYRAAGLRSDDTLSGARPHLRLVTDQDNQPHQSVRVMSVGQRVRYWALALLWAGVTASFWAWWLQARASGTPWLYWLQTTMLFYQTTLLPTVYWGFVRKMRRPVEIAPPAGQRVAVITLCVPVHESLQVIREQLDAIAEITYPHDSWILDEGGLPEVRALAEERGIHYFTRHDDALWNQPGPPFQAATKAGNVNAWLDHVSALEIEYDVFVQLDIDHRPRPDYLDRTLGYFTDPQVAWVQAPSVCGNLENWAARGLAEQDLVFQGPLQMGFYGATGTPFIIGSHTSYRMAAVREIGGFQPTRAEDHLDTVVLAAQGYRGVFVPDPIAVGNGPHDLATYLRQQFAWAYSMIQIFLHHMPRLVRRYTPGQALQFLFCQSWYALWSVSLALLWALPTAALLAHRPIAQVKLSEFALYFVPVLLVSSLMWCETRKWFQPGGVKLSWRGIVLAIARWPVVLWALINVVLRIKRPYMITPKGVAHATNKSVTLYGPAIVLTAIPLAALWVFEYTAGATPIAGYYGLALINAALGLVVLATTLSLEFKDHVSRVGILSALRWRGGVAVTAVALAVLLGFSIWSVWETMVTVLS